MNLYRNTVFASPVLLANALVLSSVPIPAEACPTCDDQEICLYTEFPSDCPSIPDQISHCIAHTEQFCCTEPPIRMCDDSPNKPNCGEEFSLLTCYYKVKVGPSCTK